jgi:hypothetical protein
MAVDGTYMGLLNEALGNNGHEWDDLVSPPPFYTTPSTQEARNKNFWECEHVLLVRVWSDTSTNAIKKSMPNLEILRRNIF